MDFGVDLGRCNPRLWLELARAGDELGYESVWLPEHLIFPETIVGSPDRAHVTVDPHTPLFDVFAMLAAIGAVTEQIRLGTNVYNIGLRHPFVTARGAATVDIISNGRFLFGVGASWLGAEWDAVGLDFSTRGARVDESIEICRRLWTEPTVAHAGECYEFGPVVFEPKPVQAHLPIHVGGDSNRALRRTAELGDGWITMLQDVEPFAAAVERLRVRCDRAGRDFDAIERTVMVRDPDERAVDTWRAAGATRLVVAPGHGRPRRWTAWRRSHGATVSSSNVSSGGVQPRMARMRQLVLCQRLVAVLAIGTAGLVASALPASGDDVEAQAVLAVTSTVDGDPGSLRDVIENDATSVGGDTVVLQSGATYTLTCAAGGDIAHGNTPLTLQGNGATITMAAGCNERLLSNGTGALELQNVVLGPVTTTFGASITGALVNTSGALTITGGVISGNSITTTAGASVLGLFNATSYSASGFTMAQNTISSDSSFFAIFDGDATVSNCSITDITVTTAGTGSIFGVVADGDLTMTGCVVSNITANAASSVFGTLADGNLTLTSSSVSATKVTATNGSIFGGIADSDLVMTDSQIDGVTNLTTGSVFGGVADGDLTMTGSIILNVGSTTDGGTIFGGVADGDLTMTNSAITGVGTTSLTDDVFGGVVDGDLTMTNSTIATVTVAADKQLFGDIADGDATLVNSSVFSTTGTSTVATDSGTFDGDVSLVYATVAGQRIRERRHHLGEPHDVRLGPRQQGGGECQLRIRRHHHDQRIQPGRRHVLLAHRSHRRRRDRVQPGVRHRHRQRRSGPDAAAVFHQPAHRRDPDRAVPGRRCGRDHDRRAWAPASRARRL